MSEGCNLPTTNEDFRQIKDSLEKGLPREQRKFASSLLRGFQKNNFEDFKNSLYNQEDKHFEMINDTLVKSFGSGKVSEVEEKQLNSALYTILKEHPNPQGLFEKPPKHRGPGSTSVDHPYEVLCAAAIVQNRIFNNIKSSNGRNLMIYSTDRVDLGQKSPSLNILSTRKKNTIESDILIQRPRAIGYDVIGLDAKYSKGTTYNTTDGLDRQLKGIKSSLSDHSLTEFHFVTNKFFSPKFKEMIDNANRELIADALTKNNELYDDLRIITKEENNSIKAIELASKLDFVKDRNEINQLTKDRVPQIGYCEKINFKYFNEP